MINEYQINTYDYTLGTYTYSNFSALNVKHAKQIFNAYVSETYKPFYGYELVRVNNAGGLNHVIKRVNG